MTESHGRSAVVVGLGNIGLRYDIAQASDDLRLAHGTCKTHVRAIHEHDGFDLLAGVDPDPRARADFEALFERRAYKRVEDLSAQRVDIAVVAVPTPQHRVAVLEVLDALKPRIVICEKPVGISAEEAAEIGTRGLSSGASVTVNYFRQYLPSTQKVVETIQRVETGTLVTGVVVYSLGLRRNASHFVRLLHGWLGEGRYMGRLPHSPGALGDSPSFTVEYGGRPVRFIGIEGDDLRVAEVTLLFEGGLLRYEHGGTAITWQQRQPGDGVRAPDPKGERLSTETRTYQRYIYDWLAGPNATPEAISHDFEAALSVQMLIDEVLDDG